MPDEDAHYCFACGADNPIGLKLRFSYGDGTAQARFTAQAVHQGYPGLMHGGLVSTLLDEAMAHAVAHTLGPAVTGELRVRMRSGGVPTEQPIALCGRIVGQRGRMVLTEATIHSAEGALLAEAEGKFMRVPDPD